MRTDTPRISFTDLQGWPNDGRRYELYDGEVSVVPAPLPRHQLALLELEDRLRDYAHGRGGLVLVSPIDIVFDEENVLQPDIVFFTAVRSHLVQIDKVIRHAPDVVVEVISPSTASNDRGRKSRMFERFEVPEYWIVDPDAERVDVLALRDGRYVVVVSAARGKTFTSPRLQGFDCLVDTLFPW